MGRNDSTGKALSLEVGRNFQRQGGWNWTPQAQLTYSHVDFDQFEDLFDAEVSMGRGSELLARIGLGISREANWRTDNGTTSRLQYYGIANMKYDMSPTNYVDVSARRISSAPSKLGAEVGAGGVYNWANNRYSLYGQATLGTQTQDFGHSNMLKGEIGFRMSW